MKHIKIIFLLVILAILFISIPVLSQGKKKELVLEKETLLPEGTKGIIGNISNPIGVFSRNEIALMNRSKQITNKHSIRPTKMGISNVVISSANGKYIGLAECTGKRNYDYLTSFALMDNSLNLLWKNERINGYQIFVSNDGQCIVSIDIVIIEDKGKVIICFYNGNGELLKKVEEPIGLEGFPKGIISEDGKYFAVNIMDTLSFSSNLILFDAMGNKIWEQMLKDVTSPYLVSFVPKTNQLIIITKTNYIPKEPENIGRTSPRWSNEGVFVYFYTIKGTLLNKHYISTTSNIYLSASENGSAVAIATRNRIYFFNAENGELLWKHIIEGTEKCTDFCNSIDVSEDGKYVVVAGTSNSESYTLKYDECGKQGQMFILLLNDSKSEIIRKEFGMLIDWELLSPSLGPIKVEMNSDSHKINVLISKKQETYISTFKF